MSLEHHHTRTWADLERQDAERMAELTRLVREEDRPRQREENRSEQTVLRELRGIGESSSARLSARLGLHRSTVDHALRALHQRGRVSVRKGHFGVHLYTAAPSHREAVGTRPTAVQTRRERGEAVRLRLLAALAEAVQSGGGGSIDGIAREVGVTGQTAGTHLNRLEAAGLVSCERRRGHRVSIAVTDAGQALLERTGDGR